MMFNVTSSLPTDFNNFLKNEENKSDLNALIATTATVRNWDKKAVITHGSCVVDCENGNSCDFYKSDSMALDGADNRIICHLEEQMKLGITKVMVRTVNSDVIILLLAFMPQFISINKNVDLFCDFGTGESRKMIIINPLFEYLGEEVCLGLLFFHSFTGCDSTTSFYGLSKTK